MLFFKNILDKKLQYNSFGKTHMPFVFYNDKNEKCMLFDVSSGKSWKLYCFDGSEVFQIETPQTNVICSECNSMIYRKNDLYYLTYTFNNMNHNYRELRHAVGSSLHDLKWVDTLNYEIGLVNEKYICTGKISYGSKGGIIDFYNHIDADTLNKSITDKNKIFTIQSKYHFAKMGFISEDQDKIIVTYVPSQNILNAEGSCIIDVINRTVKEIKLKNGQAAYKASIDGRTGDLYYAQRLAGFEVRNIVMITKNEYELVETDKIFIKN